MSHHLSGPNLRSPSEDARLDLTDTFAFAGNSAGSTVLIMNANPDFGGMAPWLHPDALYQINVDTDGDHRADVTFTFQFAEPVDGVQHYTLRRSAGSDGQDPGAAARVLVADGVFGAVPIIASDGTRVFVGPRSDPFFADLEGIQADFTWTGRDTMAQANVYSMILEVPEGQLGGAATIGVWCRVSVVREGGLVSVDRGAHPSLTAYFNAENSVKDAYNAGEPVNDWDTYIADWIGVLQHTGGYSAEDAEETLHTVLPDILRYDRSAPAAYPNGRTPTDDVTSARLNLVSGGKITSDHVAPHADLLAEFPYLGVPHQK